MFTAIMSQSSRRSSSSKAGCTFVVVGVVRIMKEVHGGISIMIM